MTKVETFMRFYWGIRLMYYLLQVINFFQVQKYQNTSIVSCKVKKKKSF